MSLRTRLTLRYAIALGLIATVLVLTHLSSGDRLMAGEHDARLIDISGQQRMLSQRIALLSIEQLIVNDEAALAANQRKLGETIDRMASNHVELSADWRQRADEGNPVYTGYLITGAISLEVERYLEAARRLVSGERTALDPTRGVDQGYLLAEALDGQFLSRLDAVVQQYTTAAQVRTAELRHYETLTLAFGLLVLLIEALFIFRPMVNRVAWCIGVLDEANEELRALATAVSTNLRSPIIDSISLIKRVDDALKSGKVAEASAATNSVYSSMITLDGVIDELLEVVGRQREAVVNFATLSRRRAASGPRKRK